jgi:hypothetical protein
MKAVPSTSSGNIVPTVGIALEGFDGTNATTTATIQCSPSTSSGTNDCDSENKIVKTGKILVFVNLGYSKLDTEIAAAAQGGLAMTNGESSPSTSSGTNYWNIDQQTGKVTASFTAGLDLKGNSLENARPVR